MNEREDLTGLVVRTALACTIEDLPPPTVHTIKLAILDLISCCIAGSDSDSARVVSDWAQETSGRRDAGIIGTPLRASAPLAALANGTVRSCARF